MPKEGQVGQVKYLFVLLLVEKEVQKGQMWPTRRPSTCRTPGLPPPPPPLGRSPLCCGVDLGADGAKTKGLDPWLLGVPRVAGSTRYPLGYLRITGCRATRHAQEQ